jgi:O-antigen/teichoic acid export membrane protein
LTKAIFSLDCEADPMIDSAIRRNVSALFILQAGAYLIPLLVLPWLTRTLGVNAFGQLSFITALVAYCILLVEWGFGLSATRQVAIFRDDKFARSKVFWDTIFARLTLSLMCLFVLIGFLVLAPRFNNLKAFLFLAYFGVMGSVISPAFYYQGMERLGKTSLINLFVRLLSVPCIFIFVTEKSDIGIAIGIQAGFVLLAAAVNFAVLLLSKELVWVAPSSEKIFQSLRDGWPLFLSTASISLYTNSSAVILGLVSGSVAVAYFSAAQTIIRAGQGLYGPISQAFFPRMSHLFHHAKESAVVLVQKLLWTQGLIAGLMSCFVFFSAPLLMLVIFGGQFELGVTVLRWLSPLLFLIGLSNVFGIQAMVPLGYTRRFSQILFVSGIFNIVIIIPLSYWFGANGGAIAVLITELLVTIAMGIHLQSMVPGLFKLQLNIFRKT